MTTDRGARYVPPDPTLVEDKPEALSYWARTLETDEEKIRRWGHESLSTFGTGRDRPRTEWLALGRALLRQGLAQMSQGLVIAQLVERVVVASPRACAS